MNFMRIVLLLPLLILSSCGSGDSSSAGTNSASSVDGDPNVCGGMMTTECDLFNKINQQRQLNGVSPIIPRVQCVAMAQAHSKDMFINNFFSHTSPTNGTFATRTDVFGVGGTSGENISFGSADLDNAVSRWMNSSGHRANILNVAFTYGGIGISQNSNGQYYYTQVFSSDCD